MNESPILYIEDMIRLLKMKRATIQVNIARENWKAVPCPVKIGKRHAWHRKKVDSWINERFGLAETEEETTPTPPKEEEEKRGRGRPRMPL